MLTFGIIGINCKDWRIKMDRVKTLLKYALWVVLFMIFSEFLINVGLNSSYRPIERKDNISQVNIYQAEATLVNGRIRGLITNSETENLSGKYLEFDFYSERDVFLGRKFIDINQLQANETQNFEILFKLNDVDYYSVSVLDEKPEAEEIQILPEGWTTSQVVLARPQPPNQPTDLAPLSLSLAIFWIYINSFIIFINYHTWFATIRFLNKFNLTNINWYIGRIFSFTVICSNFGAFY